MEEPVFDIREFIPSTSYFFHEDWQMEMVARMCPNIEKMLFIQHPKCCPTLGNGKLRMHYVTCNLKINCDKHNLQTSNWRVCSDLRNSLWKLLCSYEPKQKTSFYSHFPIREILSKIVIYCYFVQIQLILVVGRKFGNSICIIMFMPPMP